jgi:regulator of nucleoside diphosphate kinase
MKRTSSITLTHQDIGRLAAVISLYEEVDDAATAALQEELDRADVVAPTSVSPRIVTMNSRVLCRDDGGSTREVEIVYPWHADTASSKISVLAPFGRALIGAAVGDSIDVVGKGRSRRWSIEAIQYQPESAGEFNL